MQRYGSIEFDRLSHLILLQFRKQVIFGKRGLYEVWFLSLVNGLSSFLKSERGNASKGTLPLSKDGKQLRNHPAVLQCEVEVAYFHSIC